VFAERERVVGAALAGAVDPTIPLGDRAKHALRLLDAVDPAVKVGVKVDSPIDPDGIDSLGLAELEALALQAGID